MAVETGKTQFDEPLGDDATLTVIRAVQECRREAEDGRWERMRKNAVNRDAFMARQDWSHKQEGQSTEFLPKTSGSAEQMAAFIKRGLTQFGDWYSVDVDYILEEVITGSQIRAVLSSFLINLWNGENKTMNFATVLADAVKTGLFESLIILKVHGGMASGRRFKVEPGAVALNEESGAVQKEDDALDMEEFQEWRLRIDLVRSEDYYPDPTGNGLYEIHRVERDLHQVVEAAEDGVYDMKAVEQLIDIDYPRPKDEEMTDKDRGQSEAPVPSFRKRVVLDEFWGTLLNPDGTVAHRNIVCTVANDKYLIRPPEANPFWHQESPFVAEPLLRLPHSVWHKALYDDAVQLNFALNEMFNLMLDGGLAAVWGVKQVRVDDLEDPGQISGGVQQGVTLAVKSTLPHNAKVMETVTEGNVPQDAMAIFEFVNREFTQAALTNELKLGALPPKQVRATEVVEASQSQAVMLDGIVADIELNVISRTLHKAWLTVLQNADSIPENVLLGQMDKRTALLLMRASPAERFALFAGRYAFSVNGLSSTMAQAREFQKIMAMLQGVTVNPLLFQAFMLKFSSDKTLRHMMKSLNINPERMEKSQEELAQAQQEAERTQAAAQMLGGTQQGSQPSPQESGGGAELPAEINQASNPLTGMTG